MARMVMFSTEAVRRLALAGALAACGAGLAGCVVPQQTLSADFGRALHENLVAQIADPDAAYPGPPPPADGARAALAMERYRTGQVIKPVPATASKIGITSGGMQQQ
jgi:type IV pilus biogenesis protein CpaD/CtpE